MCFTQRKLFLADSDCVAGCFVQLVGSYSRIINIPEELHIIQCYLTATIRIGCSQLSLDFHIIVASLIARNFIIRYDITFDICNDRSLANHFKPVTIYRADFSRCAPISLVFSRIASRYRYVILLPHFKGIVFIADNNIGFTFTILLNHISTIDFKVLTGFLFIVYINSTIFRTFNFRYFVFRFILQAIRIKSIARYRFSIFTHKSEIDLCIFMSQNRIQGLVDSTYLQFDGSSCSTVTYRLFLNHLNLSGR